MVWCYWIAIACLTFTVVILDGAHRAATAKRYLYLWASRRMRRKLRARTAAMELGWRARLKRREDDIEQERQKLATITRSLVNVRAHRPPGSRVEARHADDPQHSAFPGAVGIACRKVHPLATAQ